MDVRRVCATLFALMLSLTLVLPAAAGDLPAVSLTLLVDGLQSKQVKVGDSFVLQVSADSAADLYGSSVDIFYDATILAPVADSQKTTAEGLVTDGLSPSQFHTANLASSGTAAARQSLVALRLGTVQGAGGSGLIGKMEFTAVAEGKASFIAGGAGAGNVTVKLASSAGAAIPVTASAEAVVTVVSAQPAQPVTISQPVSGSYANSHDLQVSGSAAPGAAVTVTVDGTTAATPTADGTSGAFTASLTGLTEGLHTISASAPGAQPVSVTVTVDTVQPAISVDTITSITSPLVVTGTMTDANLASAYAQVNAMQYTVTPDPQTGHFTVSLPLEAGSNSIGFKAVDEAGNFGSSPILTLDFALTQLQLSTDKQTYSPGDTVILKATLLNPPPDLKEIAAQISFNGSLLELPADIQGGLSVAGSILEGGETATVTPGSDAIQVQISRAAGPVAGTALAFTYTLQVRSDADPDTKPINVDSVALTNLDGGAVSAASPAGTSVTITNEGSITGQIIADGRADYSGITVKVLGLNLGATTDETGSFSIPKVPAGSNYTLQFSKKSFLTLQVIDVPVTANQSTVMPGLHLHPGNIVDNADSTDTAFLEDLGAMAWVWDKANDPTAPLTLAADLDGNGRVGLADLVLLGEVWGKAGAAASSPDPDFILDFSTPMK